MTLTSWPLWSVPKTSTSQSMPPFSVPGLVPTYVRNSLVMRRGYSSNVPAYGFVLTVELFSRPRTWMLIG